MNIAWKAQLHAADPINLWYLPRLLYVVAWSGVSCMDSRYSSSASFRRPIIAMITNHDITDYNDTADHSLLSLK